MHWQAIPYIYDPLDKNIVFYSLPAAGRLSVGIACRQPPSLPQAVQNVLLL